MDIGLHGGGVHSQFAPAGQFLLPGLGDDSGTLSAPSLPSFSVHSARLKAR